MRKQEHRALSNAAQTARILGTTPGTIMCWFRKGFIPAEIAEGWVFLFDPDKVRQAMEHRAQSVEVAKRYVISVRWREEDEVYVASIHGLANDVCQGADASRVFEEARALSLELVEIAWRDSIPLHPPQVLRFK